MSGQTEITEEEATGAKPVAGINRLWVPTPRTFTVVIRGQEETIEAEHVEFGTHVVFRSTTGDTYRGDFIVGAYLAEDITSLVENTREEAADA